MRIDFTHLPSNQSEVINQIIGSALDAVDPYRVVEKSIKRSGNYIEICEKQFDLKMINNIFVVGMGKAVMPMAAAVADCFGNIITAGMLVAKHEDPKIQLPNNFEVYYGSHPVPSIDSIKSTAALIDFVGAAGEDDLIICLISGGGSALAIAPANSIDLVDMQKLTGLLLESGARIQEINTIRKHIDRIKGGGLAKVAALTPMATLIISDVLGDDISMIASGPTSGDVTTFEDALDCLKKYHLVDRTPSKIIETLDAGLKGKIEETVKPNSPILNNKSNHLIGSLIASIESAEKKAENIGFNSRVISTHLVGEAREIGRVAGSILQSVKNTDLVVERPAVVIAGGESTVTIKGKGKGGRNQEVAFGAMHEIQGLKDCVVVALATDGEDGPTEAAGAYVTGDSWKRAESLGLDITAYGKDNDTYNFFKQLENLMFTGPTGTNVNDLLLLFAF